jgi:hypothetical protein
MVNLLSVQQLVSDGYTVTFLPDKTVVMTDERNDSKQIGAFDDAMYRLGHHMSKPEKEERSISMSSSSQHAETTLASEEKTSVREEAEQEMTSETRKEWSYALHTTR